MEGHIHCRFEEREDPVTISEDRAACRARVMGMGEIEGSVASGGLVRESETVIMPAGQGTVTVKPQTSDPIVLVPSTGTMGNSAK